MTKENPTVKDELEDSAETAAQLEAEAKAETDASVYIHTFAKPFQWEGKNYEKLTFRWDTLTGSDHLEIEFELLKQGKTLVVPEFTGEYLCGMAVRACEEWRELAPPSRKSAMKKLPLKDFSAICKEARHFLMTSESLPETEGNGSGDNA